jgi:hypothetical protein
MNIAEITRIGASRLARIRARNARNPIPCLSVAAAIVFLPAAWYFHDDPLIVRLTAAA